jgi:hypothetical protein
VIAAGDRRRRSLTSWSGMIRSPRVGLSPQVDAAPSLRSSALPSGSAASPRTSDRLVWRYPLAARSHTLHTGTYLRPSRNVVNAVEGDNPPMAAPHGDERPP